MTYEIKPFYTDNFVCVQLLKDNKLYSQSEYVLDSATAVDALTLKVMRVNLENLERERVHAFTNQQDMLEELMEAHTNHNLAKAKLQDLQNFAKQVTKDLEAKYLGESK